MAIKAAYERLYPYLYATAGAVAMGFLAPKLLTGSAGVGLDLKQIASAALNVYGLLTGLLFSVYILAIAPGGGFFERIFATGTFAVFQRYVVEALVFGALATAAVIPLMATDVKPDYIVWGRPSLTVVSFICAGSLAYFFRVFHVFLVMVSASSRIRRPKKSER